MENKKEKKGGGKGKVIAIVVVALLVVGAGGYFGYTLFFSKKAPKTTTQQQTQVQQIPAQQGQVQQGVVQQGAVQQVSPLQNVASAKSLDLGEALINLADEDGKRYLKIKVFVGYDDKKLDAEVKEKTPMLRDVLISVLRNKKAADINPKNMDNLKIEILQKMNPVLKKGQLNNIFFNDILVQ